MKLTLIEKATAQVALRNLFDNSHNFRTCLNIIEIAKKAELSTDYIHELHIDYDFEYK